jgi:glycosyltransferase involved in cell wall biosynthesis
MKPKISICIPTWEQNGYGFEFLKDLLDSIEFQSFKDFEVVISDHSSNDDILNLSNTYSDRFNIIYIKNELDRGNSPSNTNNAILNSNGEIIKTMFQDDFFFSNLSLEKIAESFNNEEIKWVVNGCNHTNLKKERYWNYMTPRWNEYIYKGVNTISSPSVLSYRKNTNILFDTNLTMLMDCEIYFNLYKNYGLPHIISDTLVTNRMHDNQISKNYSLNLNTEINFVTKKHNII